MDTVALIEQAKQGDKAARDRVITENIGLVWSIVRRFLGRGYEADDLFQIGSIGLMKAVDKFDTSFEVKFSTYAVPMITGEIKRFLRDDGMIKVSRTLKENGFKIRQAAGRIAHERGREATMEELATATELSMEEVVLALEANVDVESIYKTIYQGDGSEVFLVDKVSETGGGGCAGRLVNAGGGGADADAEKERLLNHLLLTQLVSELSEQEQRLITMRYFQEKTQTQVAKVLGVSQVQVSRMEKRILLRMRQSLLA